MTSLLDGVPPPDRRRPMDFYTTPTWATQVLLRHLPNELGSVFEPCVGNEAIVKVLAPRATRVWTNDFDEMHPADFHFDATAPWRLPPATVIQWVVTNPPFSCASGILRRALAKCENVALLLRLSFLEPTLERGPFLAAHPPRKLIVLPRHSFTGTGKTDSVTSAWMVWGPLVQRGIVVEPVKR